MEEEDRFGSDRGRMGAADIGLASTFESRSRAKRRKTRPIFAIGLVSSLKLDEETQKEMKLFQSFCFIYIRVLYLYCTGLVL